MAGWRGDGGAWVLAMVEKRGGGGERAGLCRGVCAREADVATTMILAEERCGVGL